MASTIRIKRSSVSGNPATLAAGELAYSSLASNGSNGGDRLYIGAGTETAGNAANHVVIGGKYFTDMMIHTQGVLTPNAALLTDSSSKLNNLKVDNLDLDGNSITSTNSNGDILVTPSGTGKSIITNMYVDATTSLGQFIQLATSSTISDSAEIDATYDGGLNTTTLALQSTTVTAGSYGSSSQIPTFTVDSKGRLTAAGSVSVATSLNITGNTGSDNISLGSETLGFTGSNGISTAVTSNTLTIAGVDATVSTKGVASFATANFTVAAGAVTAKTITLGSSTLSLGSTTTALAGLTTLGVTGATTLGGSLDVAGNIAVASNKFTVTAANGNTAIGGTLSVAGAATFNGNIDMTSKRVTNLAEPVADSDAATKYYVDAARAGLDVKQSVRAATTVNITLSNTQVVDGVSLAIGNRVLVKNQTTASQNGIYDVQSGAWVRSADANSTDKVTSGMFCFVESGTVNADCGFVLTTDDPITLGTTALDFALFSSSGTLIAGNGLTKTGYTLDVNTAANGGIEIAADALQLKSTVAGNGLSLAAGVLTIGGTANRITVGTTTVDIASTYVGQASITTLGTIGSGIWQGTIVAPTYGGTGVNNGARTLTLGGNLVTAGAFNTTLTTTAATSLILPTAGTLATLAGTETLTNKTITGAAITTGSINNTPIGATTRSTGAFTTLAASSTITAGGNITGAGPATSTIDGFTIDGGTY